ncbi:hypothetical protein CLOBOL_03459 [Enterocloster bolteae ATCC BAA-613]|uniref:Uncharacterized protein n=1 Tax=Enterocloster bolteae (strain ATCC BAA-613 / DSM 15670 / CCUG 46953 / JCM 12243 / WAL 16351) TaxID=411902 RepID=A8RSW0_ENTBW|nr:hypothetical protein [Enterocloster bolteae]ASN94355.1 hypothetical protein CGC65_06455 [Enterocloster bolteae]EDP16250.1 hypothetical protein CLOBOL_03459 [Enterocloster bolteae ATCC BAA-613]
MANEHAIQATGTFVVSKGFRLLTKLAASQGSLQFTRAAVGTGKPPEGYSPESMIGLNAYKIDAEIADYGVQDDMAYITVQVSSDNVTEGFLVTEVGVFAEDPDEGEILYGYMDISTDPTYIYANGSTNRSKFAEFTLYVLIGSVSNVIAAVTPGSIITRDTFTAANLKAIDTHGILGGEAGAGTTGQGLIDALTNKLLTEFVTNTGLMERLGTYVLKSKIVNDFLSTDEETVLSGPMGKLLKEQLNVLNTKIIKAPDYKNYKSVSLPFTAPNDGYICGGVYSLGTTACYIYVNSTQVGWNHSGGGSNTASPFMYPLSKGDIVTAIGYDQFRAYFIYTK